MNEIYVLNIMNQNQFMIQRVQLILSLINLRHIEAWLDGWLSRNSLVNENSSKNMLNLVLSNIDMSLKILTV